jgi:predicted lipid-binding transport protein (Tim44 family)
MKYWTLILALALTFTGMNAEAARRLGGGKSVGQQSSQVTQRQANPAPAVAPQNAAPAPAAPAPVAAQPRRPWGAMLGGLAAGLGLAWLANSLGFGEAFGQVLMFGLLAIAVMLLVGWFMRSRRAAATGNSGSLAYQAADPGASARPPSSYSPANVGNDASARPWERNAVAFDAGSASAQPSMIGSAVVGEKAWGIPQGFDTAGFIASAKTQFVTLQAAWDRSDTQSLRVMMTDSMLEEIKGQLAERDAQPGAQVGKTDVVMLQADLLGIEERAGDYLASVEFSGLIREDASAGPSPFREVWNMTKPKDGSAGWLVAGVQALQ